MMQPHAATDPRSKRLKYLPGICNQLSFIDELVMERGAFEQMASQIKQPDKVRRLRELLDRRAAVQKELRTIDQKIASLSAEAMSRYLRRI
jgi:hypothetical protein